ncbi:MAG: HD domain-containing protein [Thermaerobacter sp.]|nr:HD domain-containing protein [Thermaerobacter sp.]
MGQLWLLAPVLLALLLWIVHLYRQLAFRERVQAALERILVPDDPAAQAPAVLERLLGAFAPLWGAATPCTAYLYAASQNAFLPVGDRGGPRPPLAEGELPDRPRVTHTPQGNYLRLPLLGTRHRALLEAGPAASNFGALLRAAPPLLGAALRVLEAVPPPADPAPTSLEETFLRLEMAIVGAQGGLLLAPGSPGTGGATLRFHTGLPAALVRLIREDPETAGDLLSLAEEGPCLRPADDPRLGRLPPVLQDLMGGGLAAVPLDDGGALLGFSRRPLGSHALAALEMAAARLVVQGQDQDTYRKLLQTLVESLDAREPFYHGRSRRISHWSRMVAVELGLDSPAADAVALAALLHDVGMAGLPPAILLKQGQLTPEEYATTRRHPEIGAQLVQPLGRDDLAPMVRHHHEHFDGTGYPLRLAGEQIPLGARIIAVADRFEAKVTHRNYRSALPFAEALAQLRQAAGSQLDPAAVEAFHSAYRKGRIFAERATLPWEDCRVMVQCSEELQGRCPAAGAAGPCWEVPGTVCAEHGQSCDTCFVHSEFLFHTAEAAAG